MSQAMASDAGFERLRGFVAGRRRTDRERSSRDAGPACGTTDCAPMSWMRPVLERHRFPPASGTCVGDLFGGLRAELARPISRAARPGMESSVARSGQATGRAIHFAEHGVHQAGGRLFARALYQLDAFADGGVRRVRDRDSATDRFPCAARCGPRDPGGRGPSRPISDRAAPGSAGIRRRFRTPGRRRGNRVARARLSSRSAA